MTQSMHAYAPCQHLLEQNQSKALPPSSPLTATSHRMVKSRKLDLSAQSANSAASSLEKQYKLELTEAISLLRRHPQSRAPVIRFLKSNGFTMEAEPLALAKSIETQGKERSVNTRKMAAAAAAAAESGSGGKAHVPSKYNSLSAMSYSILSERVLPWLDPVSLSSPNLNAAFKGLGKAECKQAEALRVLEFVTGKPPTFCIKGSLWEWEHLLGHLKQAADHRGRLDKPLPLPVQWAQDGVYMVQEVNADDEVIVMHRFTEQVVAVSLSEMDPVPAAGSTFFLEHNYSELFAELQVEGGIPGQGVAVGSLFHRHATKKRKAIADGVLVSTPSSSKCSRGNSSASLEGPETPGALNDP